MNRFATSLEGLTSRRGYRRRGGQKSRRAIVPTPHPGLTVFFGRDPGLKPGAAFPSPLRGSARQQGPQVLQEIDRGAADLADGLGGFADACGD